MVKIFSKEEQYNIARAVEAAEQKTSAEIAILVAPASDAYFEYRFVSGFIFASVIVLLLWLAPALHISLPRYLHSFSILLALQTLIIVAFAWLPGLETVLRFLVPQQIMAHRSYQRATAEYFALSQHVKAKTPIVFIYLSVAERTVHIISGRIVREVLPNDIWQDCIKDLTAAIRNQGLAQACIQSIGQIADLLMFHFPDHGEHNALPNEVRQLDK